MMDPRWHLNPNEDWYFNKNLFTSVVGKFTSVAIPHMHNYFIGNRLCVISWSDQCFDLSCKFSLYVLYKATSIYARRPWTIEILCLYPLRSQNDMIIIIQHLMLFIIGPSERCLAETLSGKILCLGYQNVDFIYDSLYRSGTVNSNTVNSKFHLIRSFFEIFDRFLSFHV